MSTGLVPTTTFSGNQRYIAFSDWLLVLINTHAGSLHVFAWFDS